MADSPRPHMAVCSREGALVNLSLGEADRVFVFTRRHEEISLLETRSLPSRSAGMSRWREVAELLSDCSRLVARSAGATAEAVLEEYGVTVVKTEGMIEDPLDALDLGLPVPEPRRTGLGCGKGTGCSGSGALCG